MFDDKPYCKSSFVIAISVKLIKIQFQCVMAIDAEQ